VAVTALGAPRPATDDRGPRGAFSIFFAPGRRRRLPGSQERGERSQRVHAVNPCGHGARYGIIDAYQRHARDSPDRAPPTAPPHRAGGSTTGTNLEDRPPSAETETPAPVSRAEGGFQRHRGRRECSGLFDLVPDSGLFRIDAGFLLRHPDVVITGRNLVLDRRRLTDEPRSVGGSGSEAPAQLLAGTVRPNRALSKPSS